MQEWYILHIYFTTGRAKLHQSGMVAATYIQVPTAADTRPPLNASKKHAFLVCVGDLLGPVQKNNQIERRGETQQFIFIIHDLRNLTFLRTIPNSKLLRCASGFAGVINKKSVLNVMQLIVIVMVHCRL